MSKLNREVSAQFLVFLSQQQHNMYRVSRNELAGLFGVTVKTLIGVTKELEMEGKINITRGIVSRTGATDKNTYFLTDAGLQSICNG